MTETAGPSPIPTLFGFVTGIPFLVATVCRGVSGDPTAPLLAVATLVVGGAATLLAGAALYSASD